MELLWIGAVLLLLIGLVLIAVPLVQRRRRSGSVRAIVPDRNEEKRGPSE